MKQNKTIIALILLAAVAIFLPSSAPAETFEYPNIQFFPESMDNINWALGLDGGLSNYKLIGVQGADFMKTKNVGKKHVVDLPLNTIAVVNYTLRIGEITSSSFTDFTVIVYEYGIAVVKK